MDKITEGIVEWNRIVSRIPGNSEAKMMMFDKCYIKDGVLYKVEPSAETTCPGWKFW